MDYTHPFGKAVFFALSIGATTFLDVLSYRDMDNTLIHFSKIVAPSPESLIIFNGNKTVFEHIENPRFASECTIMWNAISLTDFRGEAGQ